MFGTVAIMKPKAGQEQALVALLDKWWQERRPKISGAISSTIHRNANNPSELIMSVVFDSEENYRANADDPEQNDWYQELRATLEDDPRWMDGEVLACKHV
jgi:quinol monooxygenase YgiN